MTRDDYENLLAFRVSLRRFLRWSEAQARGVGLTPAQHQLLLAVKGHRGEHGPTIGDLAGYLLLRHHSAVELVDRAEAAGIVERWGDNVDGRVTRVRLTAERDDDVRPVFRRNGFRVGVSNGSFFDRGMALEFVLGIESPC